MLRSKILAVATLCVAVFLSSPDVFAEAKTNSAQFRIMSAGNVSAQDAARVDKVIRSSIEGYGYQLLSSGALKKALRAKQTPRMIDVCQAQDEDCYSQLADKLGVSFLFMSFFERVGNRWRFSGD